MPTLVITATRVFITLVRSLRPPTPVSITPSCTPLRRKCSRQIPTEAMPCSGTWGPRHSSQMGRIHSISSWYSRALA